MIRTLFASLILVSVNAFAGSADLVGKWVGECASMDGGFTVSAMEFKADGTGFSANDFYSDAQCKTAAGNMNFPLTYTATDSTFVANVQADASTTIVLKGSYVIAGSMLTITVVEASVDGEQQPIDVTPLVLKRAQ